MTYQKKKNYQMAAALSLSLSNDTTIKSPLLQSLPHQDTSLQSLTPLNLQAYRNCHIVVVTLLSTTQAMSASHVQVRIRHILGSSTSTTQQPPLSTLVEHLIDTLKNTRIVPKNNSGEIILNIEQMHGYR